MGKTITCPSCDTVIDLKTGKAAVPTDDRVDELEGRLEQLTIQLEETRMELAKARTSDDPGTGDGDDVPPADDPGHEPGFGES